jgi:lysylphosphatidylglycerol synthetase-like protein (DUF2156 family)
MTENIQKIALQKEALLPCFSPERAHIVELVRDFGGSTADAILDPSIRHFQVDGIKGFVGYRLTMGCAVVFGDPVCTSSDREALSRAFHLFADRHNYRVIYICASQDYAYWAIHNVCEGLIEYGEELIFDPPYDPRKNTGANGSLVRRKSKQATREGVTIHEYIPHNAKIEEGIERVKELWLESRKGPQVHISNVYLFIDSHGKRWFYAKEKERIIGVIVLNRIESQNGWLLNHLMVIPEIPNGVPELLMASVLETLEKEKCPFATVGSIAAQQLGEIRGMGSFAAWVGRTAFNLASKVMHLKGLSTFWNKFHPKSKPSYLLFSRKKIGIRELLSLQQALSGTIKEDKHG